METEINSLRGDIKRLRIDINLIKEILLNERELTGWAKKELKIAREEDENNYLSLEEL